VLLNDSTFSLNPSRKTALIEPLANLPPVNSDIVPATMAFAMTLPDAFGMFSSPSSSVPVATPPKRKPPVTEIKVCLSDIFHI